MFAPKGKDGQVVEQHDPDEVARLLRKRYGPFVQDEQEMERLLQLLTDANIRTMDDVAALLRKNSLYALSPPIPMGVLSLLHEAYGQLVMKSPIYGDAAGKITNDEPLPVWTANKRLLADVFFFFEYFYEDGDGDDTRWPSLTRMNRTSYRHSKSSRLPTSDKLDYYGQIAIRDTHGMVRVEILKTVRMDKAVGTKEEMIRKTSARLTLSQAHFIKRNIFEEEIKELRRQYEMGFADPHGYPSIQSESECSSSETGEEAVVSPIEDADDDDDGDDEEYDYPTALEKSSDTTGTNSGGTKSRHKNNDVLLHNAQLLPLPANRRPRSVSTGATTVVATADSGSALPMIVVPREDKGDYNNDGDDDNSNDDSKATDGMRLNHSDAAASKRSRKHDLGKKKAKTLDVRSLPTRKLDPTCLAGPQNYEKRMSRRRTRSKSVDIAKRHIEQQANTISHQNNSKQMEENAAGSSIIESVERLMHRRNRKDAPEASISSSSSSSVPASASTLSSSLDVSNDMADSLSIVRLSKQSLEPQPELDDGELVVRFFGMKDNDRMLRVAGNLSRAEIDVGPWSLATFKGIKLASIAKSLSPHAMYGGMKVHGGFYQMYKSINKGCLKQHGCDLVERIVQRVGLENSSKRIVFTGHSMGAALAAIATYQMLQRYPQLTHRVFLIQFGAPRYARKKLARWLNNELDGRIMQIHLEGDQTPKSPPSPPFFGWYAPGPVIEITSKHLYARSGGKDEFGHEAHFQYWAVLRTILAYS